MIIAGRFEIEEKIGSGSYSSVYRAKDAKFETKVGVKVETQNAEISKFKQEAEFLSFLKELGYFPKIVWAGKDKGCQIIVTTLLGPSVLNDFLKKNRFTIKEVSEVGIQLTKALEIVHNKGIIQET